MLESLLVILLKKIKQHYKELTPKLKQASKSILKNLNQIPFQTIRETASQANVSVLTISRLNKIWGYKGYVDFQSQVRLEFYPPEYNTNQIQPDALNHSILSAANILTKSDSVYISGFRSAKSFALYMNYMGRMVFDNFYLLPDSGLSAAQDLAHLSRKNLLVAFSTAPYSTETVRLIKTAKSLNIKTLSFTDSLLSPLAQHSDYYVEVKIMKENKLFRMAPMVTAIEQVLEACFNILGKDADKKIDYFEKRIKAINGYW